MVKSDPVINATRLLMLTFLGQPGLCEVLRQEGVARCLTKPVKQSQLFDTLAMIMSDETKSGRPGAPAKRPTKAALPAHPPARNGCKEARILLAEDNGVNQRVALIQLQSMGYTVDAVANGVEALAALATTHHPIVFMDCQMPAMDGYEATAEIRRREAGTSTRTIIIALTAHALQGEREKCLAAGMDDYLSKPVKAPELAQMLERWSASASPSAQPCQTGASLPSTFSKPFAEVLDRAVLEPFSELQTEGGLDLISELLELYLTDATARLGELHLAMNDQDIPRVKRAAQCLKGSSHSLGIHRMTALCTELEEQLHSNELVRAGLSLTQLDDEFARVQEALAGRLQTV
jgi:two-component system sensor histidine kinase/response regulator